MDDYNILRALISEQILEEIVKTNTKSLATTVANFLRTKHGSALSNMAFALFMTTVQTATSDLMRSKGIDNNPSTQNEIMRMAIADLEKTGESPRQRKQNEPSSNQKTHPPSRPKGFLSKLFR